MCGRLRCAVRLGPVACNEADAIDAVQLRLAHQSVFDGVGVGALGNRRPPRIADANRVVGQAGEEVLDLGLQLVPGPLLAVSEADVQLVEACQLADFPSRCEPVAVSVGQAIQGFSW